MLEKPWNLCVSFHVVYSNRGAHGDTCSCADFSKALGNVTPRSAAKAQNVKAKHIKHTCTIQPKNRGLSEFRCGLVHKSITIIEAMTIREPKAAVDGLELQERKTQGRSSSTGGQWQWALFVLYPSWIFPTMGKRNFRSTTKEESCSRRTTSKTTTDTEQFSQRNGHQLRKTPHTGFHNSWYCRRRQRCGISIFSQSAEIT